MAKACWLMVLVLAAPTMAQTTLPAPEIGDIPRLIKELGASGWSQRQEAQDQLVRLGQDAVAALKKEAVTSSDEEVRHRASIALAQIENERQIGQSLVTIDATDQPVSKVVADLARQAWSEIPLDVPAEYLAAEPRITLKLKRQPFWEAMVQVCRQAKLAPVWANRMVLRPDDTGLLDGPFVTNGTFLIVAEKAARTQTSYHMTATRSTQSVRLLCRVYTEPKIAVLSYATTISPQKTVFDDGTVVGAPIRQYSSTKYSNTGIWAYSINLQADTKSRKLVEMRAVLPVTLALRSVTLTVEDPLSAKPSTATAGDTEIGFESLVAVDEQYILSVTAGPFHGGFNQQAAFAGLNLYAADGSALQRGANTSQVTDGKMACRFMIPADGQPKPTKLVWTAPAGLRTIDLSWTFKDLPLP